MKQCRHIDLIDSTGKHLYRTTEKITLQIQFGLGEDRFENLTMWMDEFKGDTPQEIADALQGWVDKLRSL